MARSQHHTLNQKVYLQLHELIVSGTLAAGEQLDEVTLSTDMDVSRTPLREAIAHLVREGLLEYRPYRGNFVRTFSAKQVNDLYLVRMNLEALAIRIAITNLTRQDLDDIRETLESAQTALEQGDMETYGKADGRFHRTIIQLTGNDTLIDMLNRLSSQIQLVRTVANQDPEVVERTARERPLILAALEARDADRAAQLMMEHIDGVRKSVMLQFEAEAQAEAESEAAKDTKQRKV